VTPSRPSSPWAPCLVPRPIPTSRAFHRRRDNIIKHFQHSYQRASAFIIQHCMSRGIMVFRVQLFMVRVTLAYPPPSTALDLDCERDDPSSADVDHCFWFLGHLCIFGYLYTSHYILLIMRLYIRGQHLGRAICYRAVRPATRRFVHIFTQDTLYSEEVALAVEERCSAREAALKW
jgi:hypothetical protein